MEQWVEKQPAVIFGKEFQMRVIDGSTIQEPGATGSTWRIHYSIGLPSPYCDEMYVTSPEIGTCGCRMKISSFQAGYAP